MESFVGFLGSATDGQNISSAFDGMLDISNTSMILIVALVLLGTNLVANMTARNEALDYAITFSALFIGALLANSAMSEIVMPVASDMAQTAIAANLGMTISSLLLLAAYGWAGLVKK